MQAEDREALRALVESRRQAALGTLDAGAPFVSMVLYALERRQGLLPTVLIHVSRLSPHTRHLLADQRASLLVALPDVGEGDPQALPRVTLQCLAAPLPADAPDYEAARAVYLERLPQQAYLFGFPDFLLVRLELQEARYVGGFARAFTLTARQLAEVFG
ncbi:MAG: pyridoxamine 5'-phosphate oxidase family protein [Chloroflexi bacterium OHK40]